MTNVLIIEDDPMVAMLNQQFIEQQEDVHVVGNVKNTIDGWNILNAERVDLILLDVFLPGTTGIEFLESIREEGIDTAVILITAADDVGTVKKAITHGVVDYLIKPFNVERFKLAFGRYLDLNQMMAKEEKKTNQDSLDRFFLSNAEKESVNRSFELPKGLARLTLELIYQQIKQEDDLFSTEILAGKIGLSRISTKKYLVFLVEIGVLGEKIEYREIGRPVTLYYLKDNGKHAIHPYLPNI